MPEERLRLLQEGLSQMLSYITQQGLDSFSDEVKNSFSRFIEQATEQITQLRQQINQPPPPVTPNTQLGEPPSAGAQLMWILAGQKEDAFVNYLRTYPDPELNALLNNPEELRRNIQFLHRMMPQGQPLQQDGIPHADLNSSNVYGFRYDPKTGNLLVRFQGGGVYGYQGVPPGVFKAFQQGAVPAKTNGQNQYGRWWQGKIPSLGAAFYQLIRQGGYPYQRLR
jgi:hypothetical protein